MLLLTGGDVVAGSEVMAPWTRAAPSIAVQPLTQACVQHRAAAHKQLQVCRAQQRMDDATVADMHTAQSGHPSLHIGAQTTVRAAKRQRLAEVVASLETIDSSLENLRTALKPESSSSSSSSSESDEDEPAASTKTKQQVAVLEPPAAAAAAAPPASPDSLQMASALNVDELDNSTNSKLPNSMPAAAAQRQQLKVCMGKSCKKRGSVGLLAAAQSAAVGTDVDVQPCKCLDKCKMGPNVQLKSEGSKKQIKTGVQVWDLPELVDW